MKTGDSGQHIALAKRFTHQQLKDSVQMESGSVFDFSGSVTMMRFRVTLIRKDFNKLDDTADDGTPGMFTSQTVDELQLQWQQKISLHSDQSIVQNDRTRVEARLFTYVEGDEVPERLKVFGKQLSNEGITQKSGYERNPVVDLPLKRNHRTIRCEKKTMYIMMYQGNLTDSYNDRDEYVVCRITVLNERSLIFEPRLAHNGYRIHSKIGEYRVNLQIWEDNFTSLTTHPLDITTLVPPLPETQEFELPDEESTKVVCLMCIDYGCHFDYESIWIEYVVYFPDSSTCTTNNMEGQTSACTMTKDGRYHFCWPIEFDVHGTDISRIHIRFRVRSEDLWGRQYVAGYACLTALSLPGRRDYRVECWRPIRAGDAVSELREFFIGQVIDIDFFNLDEANKFASFLLDTMHLTMRHVNLCQNSCTEEDGVISRMGLTTQSSGTLHVSITNVIQKREYITRETLNQIKYGTLFGRMGIRSDLYWRIMKVLMEFEEAKRQLLSLRAAH